MNCEKYEALIRLQPASLLGLEERKLLDKHLKECPPCVLQSRELQLAYAAMKTPLDPHPLNEDKLFENILTNLPKQGNSQSGAQRNDKKSKKVFIGLSCCFCHDTLERVDATYCAACLAPHHNACFIEHGRCSTIGCEEKRSVAPQLEIATPKIRGRSMPKLVLGSLLVVAVSAAAYQPLRLHLNDWNDSQARLKVLEIANTKLQVVEQQYQSQLNQLALENNELRERRDQLARNSRKTMATIDNANEQLAALRQKIVSLDSQSAALQTANSHLRTRKDKDRDEINSLQKQLLDAKYADKKLRRLHNEIEDLSKRLRESQRDAEFQLLHYENQVRQLCGKKTADEIARAGRLPQTLARMKRESSDRIRMMEEIAKVGPTATIAITPLVGFLTGLDDLRLEVRLAAIGALGAIGPNARVAVPKLKQIYDGCEMDALGLEAPEVDQVRTRILATYGEFGRSALVVVPELEKALNHPKLNYCEAALKSLASIAVLKETATAERSKMVRSLLLREKISLSFYSKPFEESLGFLGRRVGLKIYLSSKAKTVIKVNEAEVYLRLSAISVKNALDLVVGSQDSLRLKIYRGEVVIYQKDEILEKCPLGILSNKEAEEWKARALKAISDKAQGKDSVRAALAQKYLERVKKAALGRD